MATLVHERLRGVEESPADRSLGAMKHVLFIKYGSAGIAILWLLLQKGRRGGTTAVLDNLTNPFVVRHLTAIAVAVLVVAWIRRDRPAVGLVVMGALLVDSAVKINGMGLYFVNHYLVQAVIGFLGVLACGRELAGHTTRDAWGPMRSLAVMVWGLAAVKKLLHGSYLDGDFLVTRVASGRETVLKWFTNLLVPEEAAVPLRCCMSGRVNLSFFMAGLIITLSLLLVVTELIPVALAARPSTRSMVGWSILGLSLIATLISAEFDFGLTNLVFAAIWGGGRVFRASTIAAAVLFAALYVPQLANTI